MFDSAWQRFYLVHDDDRDIQAKYVHERKANLKQEMNRFQCSKAHFVALESCLSEKRVRFCLARKRAFRVRKRHYLCGVRFCPHAKSRWSLLSDNRVAEWFTKVFGSFLAQQSSVTLCLGIAFICVCDAVRLAKKSWVKVCFLDALWIDGVGKSLKNVILRLKARL